jgi:glucan phosphoethanolaminetransferase (alkaline phosphatase superfamily)
MNHFDWRTFGSMLLAAALGVAWAAFNFASTGGERGEEQLQPLVWTIFATPFFLFLGWTIARRREVWLAAFICFCVYFFGVFVAARIESLISTREQAAANGHSAYFITTMILHAAVALGLAIWRARTPYPPPVADTEQPPTNQQLESSGS